MSVNVLTEPIERGVPLIVLAPHLDDAALSCGAFMIHAATRTSVTVVTLFTEGRPDTIHAIGAAVPAPGRRAERPGSIPATQSRGPRGSGAHRHKMRACGADRSAIPPSP